MNPSLEGATGRESFQELETSELRPAGWIGASLGRSQGGRQMTQLRKQDEFSWSAE